MTAYVDFNFQVVEHGLGHLPFTEKQVVTPTGAFTGCSIFLIVLTNKLLLLRLFLISKFIRRHQQGTTQVHFS